MTVNIPAISNIRVNSNARVTVAPTFGQISATGGTVTDVTVAGNLKYRVHAFTSSGILTVTSADNNLATVEYLCVAGGGGSASGPSAPGGSGAGGMLTGTLNLNVGSYVISVGTGGAASTNGNPSFIGVTPSGPYSANSIGGGRGGAGGAAGGTPGNPGGSGGGGGNGGSSSPGGPGFGISGQGNPSGTGSGGGGGGAGASGSSTTAGIGLSSSITGFSQFYAGGGAGSGAGGLGGGGGPGTPGTVNTGGGGGSGSTTGGSGIVIIRYRIN